MLHLTKQKKFEQTNLYGEEFQFNIFNITNQNTFSHWHEHLELIYIQHGNCSINVNGQALSCKKDDIILVPPGHLHAITCYKCNYDAIVIGKKLLSKMMFDEHVYNIVNIFWDSKWRGYTFVNTHSKYHVQLIRLIHIITEEYQNKMLGYEMMVKTHISELLLYFVRSEVIVPSIHHSNNLSLQYIKKALRYLEENYKEKITLKDMCQLTNLSEQYFSKLFKQYTGKTFNTYLTQYRLELSYRYLLDTNIPITQIPEHVGFCNSNYYSRVYKQYFGVSPSSTRKQNLNNTKKASE